VRFIVSSVPDGRLERLAEATGLQPARAPCPDSPGVVASSVARIASCSSPPTSRTFERTPGTAVHRCSSDGSASKAPETQKGRGRFLSGGPRCVLALSFGPPSFPPPVGDSWRWGDGRRRWACSPGYPAHTYTPRPRGLAHSSGLRGVFSSTVIRG
jgi:hypothetical protein